MRSETAAGVTSDRRDASLTWIALALYFAAYVPYALLSKRFGAMGGTVWQVVPLSSVGALALTLLEFAAIGIVTSGHPLAFWRRLRFDARAIGMGLACGAISISTTASYATKGATLVTMVLLTRGSVLAQAPVHDALDKRAIRWESLAGLGLALGAISLNFGSATWTLPLDCIVVVAVYASCYFANIRAYGRPDLGFVELSSAQIVACGSMTILSVSAAAVATLVARVHGSSAEFGLTLPAGSAIVAIGVGALAQVTGIFGPLVLMSKAEHTYSVALNRSGSVLAGACAAALAGDSMSRNTVAAVALFVAAVFFLALRSSVHQTRACGQMEAEGRPSDDEDREVPSAASAGLCVC